MLSVIKSLVFKLFQPKQLMLRQNGEVSLLTVPSWLQIVLVISVMTILAWLGFSTSQYFSQKIHLSQLTSEVSHKEEAWLDKHEALQAKLAQQQTRIAQLDAQHAVLNELMASLPHTITEGEANSAEKGSSDVEPKSDEHLNNIELHQEHSDSFHHHATELNDAQTQLLKRLHHLIANRNDVLLASMQEAGIEADTSSQAQGGPYHQVQSDKLPAAYLQAIDSSVRLNQLESLVQNLPASMPVKEDKYYISSAFGYRKDPITGRRAYHKGVDLAGWHKTEILAPADGQVVRAGKYGGYGKFVEIQHANGVTTRYGHLHTIKVKKGQQVRQSDVIALMGSTGRSTSTHLHYEVLQDKKHINPVKLARVLERVQ
ncbi:peptidoglycan DD-metalloendopeptidase family protein [Pseudoalteromonas luteoviolacea]|uniref:peptidoglycan DD-metalloendopeptidase family protein n=1 Tax=Pseudoalteromonas luteoviolacea TaxID=43657 RepID=UPI001B369A29|nr:peptidoglycan DD-metalloendopeptidase family protein [Pseudoalteromonas luteoviolacea]MBQ4838869.1 peptidoglycan DD-metalloendopeptidase family protein [Pseudoalteromonas luteoviolacea]